MAPDMASAGDEVRRDRHSLEGIRPAMASRTAASHAAFFLPHLKVGMTLLDAGCGGGSITLGLAEVVVPGQVVGVDVEDKQIEMAAAMAASRNVANVVFRTGNVYKLPFSDDSFDAVFSHAVLEHLSDPLRALEEFRRVLKPDGIVGVQAPDVSGRLGDSVFHADIANLLDLTRRLIEHNGGNWYVGREIKRLLREAAFEIVEFGASYDCRSTAESMRQTAQWWADAIRHGPGAQQMIELGWTDRDDLERRAQKVLAWAEGPDAFFADALVHGVGRKS